MTVIIFHVFIDHLLIFGEMSIQVLCPLQKVFFFSHLKNLVVFCCWVVGVLYIFWIPDSNGINDFQIFSHILWLSFQFCDRSFAQKFQILMKSNLAVFCFVGDFGVISKKSLPVPKSCSLCVCLYAGITLFDYCSFGQRFEVRECETSNSVLFQGGFEYFGGAGEFLWYSIWKTLR